MFRTLSTSALVVVAFGIAPAVGLAQPGPGPGLLFEVWKRNGPGGRPCLDQAFPTRAQAEREVQALRWRGLESWIQPVNTHTAPDRPFQVWVQERGTHEAHLFQSFRSRGQAEIEAQSLRGHGWIAWVRTL